MKSSVASRQCCNFIQTHGRGSKIKILPDTKTAEDMSCACVRGIRADWVISLWHNRFTGFWSTPQKNTQKVHVISMEANRFICVSKWLVVKPFCHWTDDVNMEFIFYLFVFNFGLLAWYSFGCKTSTCMTTSDYQYIQCQCSLFGVWYWKGIL